MLNRHRPRAASIALFSGLATSALAQTAPLSSHLVPWSVDSGLLAAKGGADARIVFATTIHIPRSSWLRLNFEDVSLSGSAYLRITSALDGAVQRLDAVSARQWSLTSAYFNGDAVVVELFAHPNTGPSRVAIRAVTAGDPAPAGSDSICGPTDDRTLSSDPRSARHVPEGCSSWLFSDTNHAFITAGHCGVTAGDVQEFNCPLSNTNGSIVHPGPEDQYAVDPASIQFTNGGLGADYTYFACFPNSNTGLTAYQKQGQFYTIAPAAPVVAGQTIRITGFGVTTSTQAPLAWSQVQKTHTGPYTGISGTIARYQVDTTGGNSGSAIEDLSTNTVIGIHTNAGCSNPTGTSSNSGCAIQYSGLQNALANPLSLCRSGKGTITPPLYAIGDGANNFGTLNITTGNFARVKDGPVRAEGLAYSWIIGAFYAINNDTNPAAPAKRLYTIDPASGNATLIAAVTGISDPISGLGFDPFSNTLYGIVPTTGQLITINTATGAASPIGPTNPGTSIGGLEYSPIDHALYGIDDSGNASKLLKWTDPTQPPSLIGNLGAGIADCNGLGVTDSGALWTINAATEALLNINPATGAATIIGPTGGIFGASYGLSAILAQPEPSCYANCDGSSTSPILNSLDFGCFLSKFAAADTYANCDNSSTIPTLNSLDFSCFLNKFAAGCT